ncbi:MAG TPA: DUF1178 family protein [Candidatus Sulfotelmatobacter sp.]|nr:DUF1178 family protein [Candidatus Sulfotelmatobacter sp.]
MIVFDLRCRKNHVFEAWFRDSAAFERQNGKGDVTCPVCGDRKIAKALMAPNISTPKEKSSAEQRKMLAQTTKLLYQMREQVEKNCDYVGERFAEEARRIHYGETEKRNIYGEATDEQAEALREEDIPFSRIPWIPRHDS